MTTATIKPEVTETNLVLYKTGATSILDCVIKVVETGKHITRVNGTPVEEHIAEGYQLLDWDEVMPLITKLWNDEYCHEWKEITKEEYWEMLECLPPEKWYRGGDHEMFRMIEYMTGNITGHYARIEERYFCANRETGGKNYYNRLFDEVKKQFAL